jgi:hypothetical protein
MKAQREIIEVQFYSFFNICARLGWVVNATPGLFTLGSEPVPILQEAAWAPGPVWTGANNLAFTGIRFPDCQARSESLYRSMLKNVFENY